MDYEITQLSRIFFRMDQGILIANDKTKIMLDVLQTKIDVQDAYKLILIIALIKIS